MNPILGQNVILQFYKDGAYRTFMCATECSIRIATETKEVRGPNSGKWKKVRGKKLSYRVSLSGLIENEGGEPNTWFLVENQMQMLHMLWRMLFEQPETALLKIASGSALIDSSELTSSSTAFANSSFEFDGDGELLIEDSATSCNATIGELSWGPTAPESGFQISVTYEDVVNAARLEYSVDGGPRETIFSPGSNGAFGIGGLAEGSHTLQVWVVCESGVDGESNELIFEIEEGGEPGPTCAAPGIPEASDLTGSSGHFAWTASPSTPGDGYYWELTFAATGNVASSAFTNDTFTDVFGMINGAEYIFKVKSLCEEGVSESSFVEVAFTSEAPPACNVPGAPVMSLITETTATATWTAPSPAPADGYGWRLFEGLSLVNSGTTSGLTVNLTGLTSGATHTFQVRSICETGVNESGYNSVGFETDAAESVVNWELDEGPGNGTLVITVNGSEVVNETTTGDGSFMANSGDTIDITLTTGDTGTIIVNDVTASVEIVNETGVGTIPASFSPTLGHFYEITATIS